MPVYLVQAPDGNRLVDAPNKTAAVNFVVGESFPARSVTTSEMVELMQGGMTVESVASKAAAEPEAVEPTESLGEVQEYADDEESADE